MNAQIEMPKYKCHKEVWALKIKEIIFDYEAWDMNASDKKDGVIIPEEPEYAPINVSAAYFLKHEPKVGGYYVIYKGGYKSYSPAKEFEEGYSLITKE